jgi:hypothetical protein
MPVTEGARSPFGSVQAGALITMTLSLARLLGPEIRMNAVAVLSGQARMSNHGFHWRIPNM